MQFSFITLISFLLVGSSLAATLQPIKRSVLTECTVENDCCISSDGACIRQANGFLEAQINCRLIKICPKVGVPWSKCDADCCAISTGWGRGCPGK